MKPTSKTAIAIAAGIAAGGAVGILFAPGKGNETRDKLGKQARKIAKSLGAGPSKEQLTMVKGKLEKHRKRIEKHLQKINSRLATEETKA